MNASDAPDDHRPAPRPADASALDRTFASWVRTGLALAALGFIVLRLGYYLEELARARGVDLPSFASLTTPIGILHLAAGGCMILLAGIWHRHSARLLTTGEPDARRHARTVVVLITLASGAGGVGLALDLLLAMGR